jgi:hypothetical protein
MSKGTGKMSSHVGIVDKGLHGGAATGFGYARCNFTLRDRAAFNLKSFKRYIAG